MKNTLRIALAISAVIGLLACEKTEPIEEISALETTSQGYLVSSTLVNTVSVTKACSDIKDFCAKKGLQDFDEITSIDEKPNLISGLLGLFVEEFDRSQIPSFGLDVKTWRINYMTKGGKDGKEDVELTADVSFVTDRLGRLDRRLESISLFNCTYNAAEGDIAFFRDIILSSRAIHNALVVFPFYQGTFENRGKNVVTPGEFLIKARQAIDAEMAALELIEKLSETEKVTLDENYYTESMGISNGGGTSLAVQYLLENDPAVKPLNKSVRLAGTYIGEGCCSYSRIIPRILEDAPCPDETGASLVDVSKVKSAAYISAVIGAYSTWGKAKNKEDLYNKVKKYFSDDFLEQKLVNYYNPYFVEGDTYISAYINGNLYWGIYGEFQELDINDVVNPALINEDRSLKLDELLKMFKKNDEKLLSGWSPKSPLHFMHSTVDEFVPYAYVEELYNTLSNNGTNANVTIDTIDDSGHIMASLKSMILDVAVKKHPCPLSKKTGIIK